MRASMNSSIFRRRNRHVPNIIVPPSAREAALFIRVRDVVRYSAVQYTRVQYSEL